MGTSCPSGSVYRRLKPGVSSFDHAHRPEPGDFLGDAGLVDDLDDLVDVLVGGGLFLGESLVAPGAGDDADRVKLLVDPTARGELDGRGAAHHPPGTVAGGAERLRHAAGLAGEDPARGPHAPRDD